MLKCKCQSVEQLENVIMDVLQAVGLSACPLPMHSLPEKVGDAVLATMYPGRFTVMKYFILINYLFIYLLKAKGAKGHSTYIAVWLNTKTLSNVC